MINFVTEPGRWILGRWCDEWAKHIEGSKVGTKPISAAVNVYVNYALFEEVKTKCDICYYTHRELTDPVLQEKFDSTSQSADWCIAQCDNTAALLPRDKTTVIKPGVAPHFIKDRLILGVPVKEQAFDRKRLSWAKRLSSIDGVEIKLAGGGINYENMDEWYKSVDYVLITSDNEGGPMGVLEAISMCKPLIVPYNVGWCNDYPALRYHTYEQLENLVKKLVYKRDSWECGATQIKDLVKTLTN